MRPVRVAGAAFGYPATMTIGGSLVLIAIGAILRFAVTTSVTGFSIHTIGVILMIVGIVGLLIGLMLLMRRPGVTDTTAYVDRRDVY
jgi:hypothetical protein